MDLAVLAAERATCTRAHVGTVLVPKDSTVAITGYCGSPKHVKHCDEIGCITLNNHCIMTIHSEVNAIIQAASLGVSTKGATIFVTHLPCINCLKVLVNAGINKIYYLKFYPYKSEPEKRLFDLIMNSTDLKDLTILKFDEKREHPLIEKYADLEEYK